MRKTTILAIATAALAVVTVATDLIRTDASFSGTVSVNSVSHVRTTGALKATNFNAI
jgi:hypothetical protein